MVRAPFALAPSTTIVIARRARERPSRRPREPQRELQLARTGRRLRRARDRRRLEATRELRPHSRAHGPGSADRDAQGHPEESNTSMAPVPANTLLMSTT
jgi:hypothetical protein